MKPDRWTVVMFAVTLALIAAMSIAILWRVSHVETGARIGLSWRRRQDAIDNARALLALHTPRTIAAHVRRAVKHASEIARFA